MSCPRFPWGFFGIFRLFKAQYDALGLYRPDVIIPMGLASMLIQGFIFAYLYPRLFSTAHRRMAEECFQVLCGLWRSGLVISRSARCGEIQHDISCRLCLPGDSFYGPAIRSHFAVDCIDLAATEIVSAGETQTLSNKVFFTDMTTRKHYPGKHRIDARINGETFLIGYFEVLV